MSRDFQLGWPCPHLAVEEPVALSADRRTLPIRQPIASAGLVRVLANDEFYIPAGGLYSPAVLSGAVSGPYNITNGHTDFTLASGVETATITLPVGTRITADRIVKLLSPKVSNILVENLGGHLTFTDAFAVGPDSRLRVSGKAASALGFEGQQAARGQEVYPGWRLVRKAGTADASDSRYPQFVRPVKTNPTFKATYSMAKERCLRCGGVQTENDFRIDVQGDLIEIENENLLNQAALKILLTRKGSNPYNPWYGTSLMSRIGTKAIGAVATLINEDVRNALVTMQKLQTEQAKYQSVSTKERLYRILSVNVKTHNQDPTAFLVDVTVSNGSGQPINLTVVFTVPGAVALMGSNGLSLGVS